MNKILEQINFYNSLDSVVKAVVLLVIALIFACIARVVFRKITKLIVSKVNDNGNEEVDKSKNNIVKAVGKLAFAITFVVFLPGALEKLGISTVTAPMSDMGAKILKFMPNLLAAIIIMLFGIFLSKFVKEVLVTVLKKAKLDSLQEKCGIKNNNYSFSEFIGKVVYGVLIVVFAVASIRILHIEAVSTPATAMLNKVLGYVPELFAAAILILFGIVLASIVGNLLETALVGTTLDEKTAKLYPKKEDGSVSNVKTSRIISTIVKVVMDVIFVVSAIKILKIDVLTKVGTTVIAYLPSLLAAVIIAIIAWICANKASEVIIKTNSNSTALALVAKSSILALAAVMILQQLGINTKIITILFAAVIIAIAVAFALAFGLGGRAWAGKKLEEIDENIKDKKKKD